MAARDPLKENAEEEAAAPLNDMRSKRSLDTCLRKDTTDPARKNLG